MTEVEIVGFEGQLPHECPMTWGAAAVRHNGKLLNSWTGAAVSDAKFAEYVAEGVVTPVSMRVSAAPEKLIVVAVVDAWFAPFEAFGKETLASCALDQCIVDSHAEAHAMTQVMFTAYCRRVVSDTLAGIDAIDPARARWLLRSAMTLDWLSPGIHAARMRVEPNETIRGRIDRTARATLARSPATLAEYERLVHS